jgi:hypothetical protein
LRREGGSPLIKRRADNIALAKTACCSTGFHGLVDAEPGAGGSATVRLSAEKGMALSYPRLWVAGATICMGMGETLEAAHQVALDQAYDLLLNDYQPEPFMAYAYASARVAMRFGGPACPIVLAVAPDLNT